MTTNAGSDQAGAVCGFGENAGTAGKEKTERALLSFLRPEFINRVDEIITFRSLDRNDFVSIARIMLGELGDVLAKKGIRLTYSEDVPSLVASESYSLKFGARNMRRYIETKIEDPIANAVIAGYRGGISGIHLSVSDQKIAVESI